MRIFLLLALLALLPQTVMAQTAAQSGPDKGKYRPGIWVDPDGCEHWVMDDGAEGYMTPHLTREGIPVCNRRDICRLVEADQNFATDSYRIGAAGAAQLADFFRTSDAEAFIIIGHTDSRASDAYNMRLSLNRARAVAAIGQANGVRIADVRGLGESQPVASNDNAKGRAMNRRVEILCVR